MEFSFLTLNLLGSVKQLEYEIDPPLIYYPFNIAINELQTSVFKLTNLMNCPGNFKISFIGKSSENIICKIEDVIESIDHINRSPMLHDNDPNDSRLLSPDIRNGHSVEGQQTEGGLRSLLNDKHEY